MPPSIFRSIASLLGPSEVDRIQNTLNTLDAAPENVPTAKLMIPIVDRFFSRQTRRPRSRLTADIDLYSTTKAVLPNITLEDLEVSLDPDKNERYTGVAGDERRRRFQVLKQQIDGIRLEVSTKYLSVQYRTTSQGMAFPALTSTEAGLDHLTQPTQIAEIALNLEFLVGETRTEMKIFRDKDRGVITQR